jgi:uncharacterized protein (DUF885 family)
MVRPDDERGSVNERLAQLADRYWDRVMEANPMWASLLGDHRFDAEVENLSRSAEEELTADLDSIVVQAKEIDPSGLDKNDRITRHVLLSEAASQADALRSRLPEFMVDPMLGVHMDVIQGVSQLRANDAEQANAYLEKASKTGRLFDQALQRHRDGVANGRTPPQAAIEKVLKQIDAYLETPLTADAFMQISLPEGMDIEQWQVEMIEQVREVVRPAFARYRDGIATDIAPHGRPPEKSGVCWLPDGEEIYRRAVKRYTTLDLDPRDVHQIGLDEIAALEDEYRALGGPVLGTTNVAEIYERLRNDPALRFETADQVHQAAESALARAREAIPQWFGRLPEAPCMVQPIPDIGAADATLAYYFPPADDGSRPGIFFINLSEPTTRTRFESEALAFHESIPGHHLQIAIAQELEGVPTFRRNGNVTVYAEGWGLYTERLSDEMGLYSGDLERMGILSFDSWRAGRLVVDTGLHALGWSRQQAIDYFMKNSPQAPNNIVNEVDRYIGYVGQALAYKIGQREFFRLREHARKSLGSRFDIKAYHDTVLEDGPVPLDLLGELVEEWIRA